jgi:hypothetical protein
MLPLAPFLLTTTTGWPKKSGMVLLRIRAARSVAPPGPYGTYSFTGLVGYFASLQIAFPAASTVRRAKEKTNADKQNRLLLFIVTSFTPDKR